MLLNAHAKMMNDGSPKCPPECSYGLNADHTHPLDDDGTILTMCVECGAIVALAPVTTDGGWVYTSAADDCRQCPEEGAVVELTRSQAETILRLHHELAFFRDPDATYPDYDHAAPLDPRVLGANISGRIVARIPPLAASEAAQAVPVPTETPNEPPQVAEKVPAAVRENALIKAHINGYEAGVGGGQCLAFYGGADEPLRSALVAAYRRGYRLGMVETKRRDRESKERLSKLRERPDTNADATPGDLLRALVDAANAARQAEDDPKSAWDSLRTVLDAARDKVEDDRGGDGRSGGDDRFYEALERLVRAWDPPDPASGAENHPALRVWDAVDAAASFLSRMEALDTADEASPKAGPA
jgi:hypothetical protein